jgi:hypothetical protein
VGSGYYARTIIALVPALERIIKTGPMKVPWVIDWDALGIDPKDPKWDAFHVKAGGTLPRDPTPKNGTKLDWLDGVDLSNAPPTPEPSRRPSPVEPNKVSESTWDWLADL